MTKLQMKKSVEEKMTRAKKASIYFDILKYDNLRLAWGEFLEKMATPELYSKKHFQELYDDFLRDEKLFYSEIMVAI